ncbi:MAG: bifunctional serine/threonine-protein kinase/formylglycine-generating enzyme family protein [Myxococcota bacterium]
MNDENRARLRQFVEDNHLGRSTETIDAHVAALEVLFDDEDLDPANAITSYLRGQQLPDSLADGLLQLYREFRAKSPIGARYRMLAPLTSGGMGVIRIVFDERFRQRAAMKVLRRDRMEQRRRFEREISILAELQHPNILPIHDCGRMDDGRPWCTMPLVEGVDFGQAVQQAHAQLRAGTPRWEPGAEGWPLIRPLLRGFLGVCEAIAAAHRRGILHRDISPHNVHVGPHNQHYVLDWGLARRAGDGSADTTAEGISNHAPVDRTVGFIGSPRYIAPELAYEQHDQVDERTDVYALGALLYLLLSNRPPYEGTDWRTIVQLVRFGPPPPPGMMSVPATMGRPSPTGSGTGSRHAAPPRELVEICEKAMHRESSERYESANDLAEALQNWLDGATVRQEALRMVEAALDNLQAMKATRTHAATLRQASQTALEGIQAWADDTERHRGWELEDEAQEAEQRVLETLLEVRRELHAALRLVPSLERAHEALLASYTEEHRNAEAQRDWKTVFRTESSIRLHVEQLPVDNVARRDAEAYLDGQGTVTLQTHPPGAKVEVWRYEEQNRRLVLVREPDLDTTTPLVEQPFPMGSYRLTLKHPDRAEVLYPIEISRQQSWEAKEAIWLPPKDYLSDDEVYVAAGWYYVGGDASEAYDNHPLARVWLSGFVMQRVPVTNEEYLAFLDACDDDARERYVPRPRSQPEGPLEEPLFDKVGGRYVLQHQEVPIHGRLPVTNVDWHCAMAYLNWKAEDRGRPWRLPGDLEWEKAARGADGRIFPWGNHLEASRCRLFNSQVEPMNPVPVDEAQFQASDESPYGVCGLAGNVRDWCYDARRSQPSNPPQPAPEGGKAIVRGGSWRFGGSSARATSRSEEPLFERFDYLGFRGVYPIPWDPTPS